MRFVDPDDPGKGLLFDGRLAEDFKLSTGTWVSVGPLRARFVDHCAPLVRDVVIAGADRDDIAALVFPDVDACRGLAGLAADAPAAAVLARSTMREEFRTRLERAGAAEHRQLDPHLPRDPAGRAAVARRRRNDRQGLDQPARRADAPRGAGRRTLREGRRRPKSSSSTKKS